MQAVSTMRPVRVLPHIKRLDDCFGDFLVRVSCSCGASRHMEPEALARIPEPNHRRGCRRSLAGRAYVARLRTV